MKKILVLALIIFLLVVNVKASAFAIIGMQGLQLVNPEAAKAVGTVICVANPIACAEGRVVSYVAGEAIQALAEVSPEAARAVTMANQIKGYIDEGAAVVDELQLNENGEVTGGGIKIGKEQDIGNLMNSNLDKESIKIADSEYSVENGVATVMVGDNGYVKIKDKETGLGYSYENIKKGGLIKLDNKGKVTETDFAAKEGGGTYAFGGDVVKVPSNARVIYKNGEVKVVAKEGDTIETSQIIGQGKQTASRRISVLKDGDITVKGNNVYGKNFIVDNRLQVIKGSVFLEEEGIVVGENTNAFADKLKMNIETNRYQSVMFYNEGAVPCREICYPAYILPGANKIEMSSRDIDGFYVGFEKGNPYTGKEFSYIPKGGLGEVKVIREGDVVNSIINTGEEGIVKYSSGNQKLEFQNGEVYSSIENAAIKINDPDSNLNTKYGDISVRSFEGSTDFCRSFSSATGFAVLDFVTGFADAGSTTVCSFKIDNSNTVNVEIGIKKGILSDKLTVGGKEVTIKDFEDISGKYYYQLKSGPPGYPESDYLVINKETGEVVLKRIDKNAQADPDLNNIHYKTYESSIYSLSREQAEMINIELPYFNPTGIPVARPIGTIEEEPGVILDTIDNKKYVWVKEKDCWVGKGTTKCR